MGLFSCPTLRVEYRHSLDKTPVIRMVSQPSQIFIGRQQELAALTAALDNTVSGRGQMVMLAGEPGIGKTRLAQELTQRALESDFRVLWGWCYEGEGAPSYWPWVDSLRTYVQAHGL